MDGIVTVEKRMPKCILHAVAVQWCNQDTCRFEGAQALFESKAKQFCALHVHFRHAAANLN